MTMERFLHLLLLLPCLLAAASLQPPGCKIRVTSKGLDLVKQEGLKFVEQELENLTIPDLSGSEGKFHYTINQVKVTELDLTNSDLHFKPSQDLVFDISNASISLSFQRKLLYWFFYDTGIINASADGVNIKTQIQLAKDVAGRLKISNITCAASIARMYAQFSGTLKRVYDLLATFITTGMRFLLNQQICPVLNHAGLVLLNSLLDTVPVRNPVDDYIGIDYSLRSDPIVTDNSLEMDFKGMFFHLSDENDTAPNQAVFPVIKEDDRMVYVALSEYFFDSAMYAYYKAGVLQLDIMGEKMPKDLEILLRTTYFGSIMLLNPAVVEAPMKLSLQVSAPPRFVIKPSGTTVSVSALLNIYLVPSNLPAVQLTSMTMEMRLNANVSLKGKLLQVVFVLKRFRIYSNQSALESLALIPLQGPLMTMIKVGVMPMLNDRTKRGVQIPLPEGLDFIKETVTNHAGFICFGGDLHFSKSLREVIEKYRPAPSAAPTSNSTSN